jgi:hypothetical protein
MALDESLGVTLPNIPFGGKPGAAGEAYQKFLKENEPRAQQGRQAKEELELGKSQVPMQVQAGVAGAKAAGAEETARQIRDMPELAEFKEKNKSRPAFVPTQESAKDIMNLFTLTAVIGFALGGAGKAHAQQALSAMNGMVEGHLKGRDDLYKREKDIYDLNMKAIDRTIEGLKTEIAQGTEVAKLGGTAATEKNTQAAYSKGATSLGDLAKKLPLVAFNDNFNEVAKNWAKVTEGAQKEEQRAASEEAAMKRAIYEKTHPTPEYKEQQYQMLDGTVQFGTFDARSGKYLNAQHQPMDMSQVKSANTIGTAGKGGTSVLLAGRAENIREAFTQAAQDLINVTKFPPNTVLGTFAGMTGQSGSGLSSSLANTFARKISSDESRMFQQLVSGLEGNLASALGGGYANSAAKSRIDLYKSQIPQSGDDGYVAANFLARIKQELNILADNFASKPGASTEMNDKVQKANDEVNRVIPFTVDDVLAARSAGTGAPTAGKQKPTLQEFITAARAKNPTYTEKQITDIYKQKYGGQ